MSMNHASAKKGFGLIEIVVAVAMATAALAGFSHVGIAALRLLTSEKNNLEAMLLAQEGLEAVRLVRDGAWAAVASSTDAQSPSLRYYPVVQNGKWILATVSPGLVNGRYDRFVQFEKVSRDGSDRIAAAGGTDDAGTRKVIATVSSAFGTTTLTAYITNFQSYLNKPVEKKVIGFDSPGMTDGDLASFPSDNGGTGDPAQGFTTGGTPLLVSKVELLLSRPAPQPSPIYLELRAGPAGAVLGTSQVITSATLPAAPPAWTAFQFPDTVPLNASAKYYIRLRSIPSSTDAGSGSLRLIYWDYLQTPSSPYPGGEARRFIGSFSNANNGGQPLDEYDFGFRIYALQ